MGKFKVISVDLDMPRKGADYSYWTPHVDGGGSWEFDTLEDAIAACDHERGSLYTDSKIEGDGVPEEYARFDCNWSYPR